MFENLKKIVNKDKKNLSIKGRVKVERHSASGKLIDSTGWLNNTITTAGLAVVAGLVGNVDTQTAFTYLAVGTSSTAESSTHTALQSETTTNGLARAAATVSRETTTATDDTLQLYKQWTASGTIVVEEIGAFNASSSGNMLGRKLTTTKTVNSGETLTATYQFIFS